jgi:hypothetical protein
MRITKLCFLAFSLNGALDTGRFQSIGIDTVLEQIDRGLIFEFLEETLGDDIDLSVVEGQERQVFISEWRDLRCVSAPRKFAVERNGLCLLVAYLLEGIQRRRNINPPIRIAAEKSPDVEKRPTVN